MAGLAAATLALGAVLFALFFPLATSLCLFLFLRSEVSAGDRFEELVGDALCTVGNGLESQACHLEIGECQCDCSGEGGSEGLYDAKRQLRQVVGDRVQGIWS